MKDKKLEQLIKEELQKEINTQFAFACLNNDIETVKEYLKNDLIDNLGYEKGLFGIYAAMNGNQEVLNILYQNSKSNELKEYQHNILITSANYGQIDCINFLLSQGANPLELKNTTAYNNYHEVEQIFTKYEAEHQIKFGGEAIVDIHNDF